MIVSKDVIGIHFGKSLMVILFCWPWASYTDRADLWGKEKLKQPNVCEMEEVTAVS